MSPLIACAHASWKPAKFSLRGNIRRVRCTYVGAINVITPIGSYLLMQVRYRNIRHQTVLHLKLPIQMYRIRDGLFMQSSWPIVPGHGNEVENSPIRLLERQNYSMIS